MRGNFNQIDVLLFRQAERIGELYDAERLIVDSDETHFGRRNFAVDAMRLFSSDVTFPLKIKKRAALLQWLT